MRMSLSEMTAMLFNRDRMQDAFLLAKGASQRRAPDDRAQ